MVIALQAQSDALQTQNTSIEKALQTERAKISALDQHIATLEQQLAALRRARYGRRSEQLDEHIYQLELMLEDLGASVGERDESDVELSDQSAVDQQTLDKPEQSQSKQSTPRLPEHLPRDTLTHEPELTCDCCGEALSEFAQDCSEQLEYVPASFRVIKHIRPKYRCGCEDKIHQADAPSRPIPRGYAGPGLLSHVAIAKFLDHLPLYLSLIHI